MKPQTPIHTAVLCQDPEKARLWASEEPHITSLLLIEPDQETREWVWAGIEENESHQIHPLHTPQQLLDSRPDVTIVLEPGLAPLTAKLRKEGLKVLGSGVLQDSLEQDLEVVRNAISSRFKPNEYRRFIRHLPISGPPSPELFFHSLKFPQDQYHLIFPSGPYAGVSHSAADILNLRLPRGKDEEQMGGLLQDLGDTPFVLDVVGMFSKCKGAVANDFGSHTGRFLEPLMAFVEIGGWRHGQTLEAESAVQYWSRSLELMLASMNFSGPLRMRMTWSAALGYRIFDISPSIPTWQLQWWRNNIAPDQSWHSLWRAVSRGADFSFKMLPPEQAWQPEPLLYTAPPHWHNEAITAFDEWQQYEHCSPDPECGNVVAEITTIEEKEEELTNA